MSETETLEQRIIRTWKADAELQAEFMGDFQSYIAFCEANAKGAVRISGQGKK